MTRYSLRLDRRGVSEVIGSILVFGLVVALITLMQVQAVPNANEEVEFEHSSDVSGDLSKLQGSMSEAGFKGSAGSTTVKLGADYPPRMLFFNPPPVNGRLTTENNGSVTIANVQAIEPEVEDYYAENSNSLGYATKSIRYRANYNEYHKSPISYIESSRVYHQYDNGTVVENPGNMVEGRKISLLLVDGNLTKSGVEARSIETKPLSAPANAVAVTDTGTPVQVTVPTNLSEEKWVTEILADEIDDPGSPTECADIDTTVNTTNDRYVDSCSHSGDEITITFEPGVTYELRTSKVGVGQTNDTTTAAYLTPTNSRVRTAVSGGTIELSVEVRDRYNNPVSGEDVTFDLPDGTTVTVPSNANGVASVEYTSSSSGTKSATATIDGGSTAAEVVEFSIQSVQSGGGSVINPGSGIVLDDTNQVDCSNFLSETIANLLGGSTCDATATFENTDSTTKELDSVRVAVYSNANGDMPEEATIYTENDETTVEIGRDAESHTATFEAGNLTNMGFVFDDGGDAAEDDFFVLELRFKDGSTPTYFIPIDP